MIIIITIVIIIYTRNKIIINEFPKTKQNFNETLKRKKIFINKKKYNLKNE